MVAGPRGRFLDALRIVVKGGCGGHGLPKYGGVGGKGGDVILEASKFKSLKVFLDMYPHRTVTAHSGKDSTKMKMMGEAGPDKVVKVPVGVTVYESDRKLGELNEIGEQITLAKGGPGGGPKSIPPFNGGWGEERTIVLDLKLIADVGLVGFPNAGKSTLLKAISRARPQIASYPFTTLRPNIGVVEYEDKRQIQLADLPGLIEGAWKNLGMGHKFLKHVERTSMLLIVADVAGFSLSPGKDPHRSCLDTVVLLIKELELYNDMLLKKPIVVAVNKMDLPDAEDVFRDVKARLAEFEKYVLEVPEEMRPKTAVKFAEVLPMSARFDPNSVQELKEAIRKVCDEHHLELMKQVHDKNTALLIKEIKKKNKEVTAVSL